MAAKAPVGRVGLGLRSDGCGMSVEPRQNAAEIQRRPPQVAARRRPSRRKPTRLDHRTRVGKRARELSHHFAAAISASGRQPSIDLAVAIGRAAELVALAEDLRARMLRADPSRPLQPN